MPNRQEYHWIDQACPICELPPKVLVGKRGGVAHRAGLGVECNVWRCHRCGLIFPNPMPFPVNGLEQHYGVDPSEYFQHHDVNQKDVGAQQLVSRAESLIGGRGKLLDVGAGRGEVLRAAIMAGWNALGIELSPTFADHAAEHSGAEILRKPLRDCAFPDDSFDAVILAGVLEHLYDPNEMLQEIARILRSGGVLFLDVPNEAGLYFHVGNLYERLRRRDWVVNLSPTFPPFHVFGFTPKSLRKLPSKHGFEVRTWYVYPGTSLVPPHGGLAGVFEQAPQNW